MDNHLIYLSIIRKANRARMSKQSQELCSFNRINVRHFVLDFGSHGCIHIMIISKSSTLTNDSVFWGNMNLSHHLFLSRSISQKKFRIACHDQIIKDVYKANFCQKKEACKQTSNQILNRNNNTGNAWSGIAISNNWIIQSSNASTSVIMW